jgi:hypothetical protein
VQQAGVVQQPRSAWISREQSLGVGDGCLEIAAVNL